jgi:hypothetical protein
MKFVWVAVALALTGIAGVAAAQSDTRVAMVGLYSPIPQAPSGIIRIATQCTGAATSNCGSLSKSTCSNSYLASSSGADSRQCIWSGNFCAETGATCSPPK